MMHQNKYPRSLIVCLRKEIRNAGNKNGMIIFRRRRPETLNLSIRFISIFLSYLKYRYFDPISGRVLVVVVVVLSYVVMWVCREWWKYNAIEQRSTVRQYVVSK